MNNITTSKENASQLEPSVWETHWPVKTLRQVQRNVLITLTANKEEMMSVKEMKAIKVGLLNTIENQKNVERIIGRGEPDVEEKEWASLKQS